MQPIIVSTKQQLDYVETLLLDAPDYVVVDTETNGLNAFNGDQIVGLALYFPHTDEGFYIPIRHEDTSYPQYQGSITHLNLSRPDITYVGFNYKFDLHFLYTEGFGDPETIEDVMLAAQLANENEDLTNHPKHRGSLKFAGNRRGAYQLKRLAKKYLGDEAVQGEELLEEVAALIGVDPKKEIAYLPADVVGYYAVMDVYITWQLRQYYMPVLREWKLSKLYAERNASLLKVLTRIERNGLYVNADLAQAHMVGIQQRLETLEAEFKEQAAALGLNPKGGFNPNSTQQLATMFNLMGQTINGKPIESTSIVNLRKLIDKGFVWAQKAVDLRVVKKSGTGFYQPYIEARDPFGYVHPTFNSTGTVTGRLSCSNPNLQQLPRKSKKYRIKQIVEAPPGYVLVQLDYKQLELRLGTHFANEETMRAMFLSGEDMHQYTADRLTEMLGRPIERHFGKTANFSFMYGMGAELGADNLQVTVNAAKQIIEGWHKIYPAYRKAAKSSHAIASRYRTADGKGDGPYQYLRLAFNGRVRRFHEFNGYFRLKKDHKTGKAYVAPLEPHYTAWSFLVQGTAAAIVERSLLTLMLEFDNNDLVKPFGTVHDSFVAYVREDYVQTFVPRAIEIMTDYPQYSPSLGVDAEVGYNWFDIKPYDTFVRFKRRFPCSVRYGRG